ncbi:MAG: class I SAM-dependent methyltransferase, partial [Acidobacteriota bacterium]|nr:class I SAM-dependent methyltransferase [Acidobacteriota bacterium]
MGTSNEEQVRFWNEDGGPKWVEYQKRLDRLIAPMGDLLLQAVGAEAGQHVLEIGCGTGFNTVELAKRVTRTGLVVGVDVSRVMLDAARTREAPGLNMRFLEADAQTADLGEGIYDLVVSRFGVMFFDDPPAAFANIRRALKPDGRLVFLCWQSTSRNPWVREPTLCLDEYLTLPEPPPPGSPGPFSLGNVGRLERVLDAAGFSDFEITGHRGSVFFGEDVEAAVEFLADIAPTSRLLADASLAERAQALNALRALLSGKVQDGKIEMPAATWIVT